MLRQQLEAIRKELGEFDESAAEASELRQQLDAIALPDEVRRQVDRELKRLEQLPPQAAEHGVIRTYLEWIASLPWDTSTEDNLDLAHAREVLDEDHYDIEQVKDRILEFLAVRRLKPGRARAASCASSARPASARPRSGARSPARSAASFERISVGGMRDEAEIRGHRRTYIGAMPGTIIRALRDAGSNNPLFMIDEIDKMGSDWRGDPSSAMLEVLDPEQNGTFRDYYLDVPFDLSRVMFITTANTLDTIPGPLRDRMEVIELAGYTEEEKLEIAKRYLVPRQIERNGLKKSWLAITDKALRVIISDYTREAGVRNLEREIGTVCRKIARQVAEGNGKPRRVSVGPDRVRELLGRPRFHSEAKRRTQQPGVATGLAWTPVGGDVLFIEATAMPGKGKLTITGQLGDVMQESAQAALSYVRGHHARDRARPRRRLVRRARPPHPRARRRDPEGRPERGHHDGDRAVVAHQRALRPRRRRDDRRGDADRPGAADRRPEGEGARRAAQRHHDRDRARAERGRRRGDPRASAPRHHVRVRRVGARGARRRARVAADERPRAACRRGQRRPRAAPKARV